MCSRRPQIRRSGSLPEAILSSIPNHCILNSEAGDAGSSES